MEATRPDLSMSASRVTLPVMKPRRASDGATARTDLMSCGGTMVALLSGMEVGMGAADVDE